MRVIDLNFQIQMAFHRALTDMVDIHEGNYENVRGKVGRPHGRWRADSLRNSDRSLGWDDPGCGKHGTGGRIDLRASE